jgi:hypothetical protein
LLRPHQPDPFVAYDVGPPTSKPAAAAAAAAAAADTAPRVALLDGTQSEAVERHAAGIAAAFKG